MSNMFKKMFKNSQVFEILLHILTKDKHMTQDYVDTFLLVIGFIDFLLDNKSLAGLNMLFPQQHFRQNGKTILEYFQFLLYFINNDQTFS